MLNVNKDADTSMQAHVPNIVVTLHPQLALGVATSLLLVECEEPEPINDLVSLGVALCDVVYDPQLTVAGPLKTWAIAVPETRDTARDASLANRLHLALQEIVAMRQQLQELGATPCESRIEEVSEVHTPVTALYGESGPVGSDVSADGVVASLEGYETANAEISAVVAEAVKITKVAVVSAGELRVATAEALRSAHALSTAVEAEAVAQTAARTASGVRSRAETAALTVAGAARRAAAELATTVTAAAAATALDTARAASAVSEAVVVAAGQAEAVARTNGGPGTSVEATETIAQTAARAAAGVESRAAEAAVAAADAATDAAARLATTVSTTATNTATETTLAALTVSRAVAVAAAEAASMAAEAAVSLELEVRRAASAVQAIALATLDR